MKIGTNAVNIVRGAIVCCLTTADLKPVICDACVFGRPTELHSRPIQWSRTQTPNQGRLSVGVCNCGDKWATVLRQTTSNAAPALPV